MPGIGLEQRKLLICPVAYLVRQPVVPHPKASRGPVSQTALASERLRSPAPVIVGSLSHDLVQTPRGRICLNAEINRLRPAELVEPRQQFIQFLRRKTADSRFDLLDVGHTTMINRNPPTLQQIQPRIPPWPKSSSASHDSDLHKRRIRDLAADLRTHQLDVVIDQDQLPGGPDEGCDHWSETQVRAADKVLIACTESYCARYHGVEVPGVGLGSIAEARLIHRIIYNAAGINPKFRVILFQESDPAHVPDTLQTYHRFPLYSPVTPPNPLVPPATPHTWDMANRRDITERPEQMLTGRSPKRILLLSAASNPGKTHLLAELKSLRQAPSHRPRLARLQRRTPAR